MPKKTIRDIDLKGKRVLVRVDYNVPLDENGKVQSDKRIKATLPTLSYLLEQNAKIIIVTHTGRPKGEPVEALRTTDIARVLGELLSKEVKKVNDCIGREVEKAALDLKEGEILMLENVRFHAEEKKNDSEFARKLAGLAEVFVNDGFAVCHRDQASVTGVAKYLPAVAGFLVEKEVAILTKVRDNPEKPLMVVMGGVKLETRIPMIETFVAKAEKILFGGAMIFTFFKAMGYEVGKSLVDETFVSKAKELLEKYSSKLVFPVDVTVAPELKEGVNAQVRDVKNIRPEEMGLDVGPKTVELFLKECENAKTIVWNGPLGAFETKPFNSGTALFGAGLAKLPGKKVIGGGDTARALKEAGLSSKMDFVSTGGGASLTLLEGGKLPGVEALLDK